VSRAFFAPRVLGRYVILTRILTGIAFTGHEPQASPFWNRWSLFEVALHS